MLSSLTHLETGGRPRLVRDEMLTAPKTLPADTTCEVAARELEDPHVHLLLLVEDRRLVGTVDRSDLDCSSPSGLVRPLSTLAGRTVRPDAPLASATERMRAEGRRRLAVVDSDGVLLGLLCLKHHGQGFCSADDVASRRTSEP